MSFKIVLEVGGADVFRLCPCSCESGAGGGAGGGRSARRYQKSRTWGSTRRPCSLGEKTRSKKPTERG